MESQKCPGCGEENPLNAVMCWACFTPFPEISPTRVRLWQFLGKFGIRPVGDELRGLTGIERLQARPEKLDEPVARILRTILEYAVADNAEAIRIEPQAVKEPSPATEAEIKRHRQVLGSPGFGVRILYRVNEQWQEQMKVPGFVLKPLVERIKDESAPDDSSETPGQTRRFRIDLKDISYEFQVTISSSPLGEVLLLTLQ